MPVFECPRCNEMTYSSYAGVPASCARCGSHNLRVIEGAFDDARRKLRDLAPGDHASLVFDDASAAAPFCARYLTEGIEAGSRVVAALPEKLESAVRDLLGSDIIESVEWESSQGIYGDFDADRIAATYDSMIASEGRTTRILAGPTSADGVDLAEFDRYERLAHSIVTSRGAVAVCVFDASALPDEFVDVANRRHSLAVSEDGVRRNERFEYEPV